MAVLVTGGTGTLGRPLVARLGEPRVLSRRPGPGRVVADLRTGAGLDVVGADVEVVDHCATRPRGGDAADTGRLIEAIRRHGRPHLVLVSIVGCDRVPLPYYREKTQVERLVETSGLPWTVLRATQFHDLLAGLFAVASRSGVLPVLAGTRFQPVAVDDVADRLAALARGPARGRVDDLGGPQVRSMAEWAGTWARAVGRRRRVVPVRLPGRLAAALREGHHLTPDHAEGVGTFDDFLARDG